MKVKTSLTLSEDLLKRIDECSDGNRSLWIEEVVREHLRTMDAREGDQDDAAALAAFSARNGPEASDVLDYSAPLTFESEE
ncbi:MAG: hypothetical protein WD557_19830 [Dehalococcoidia bacterium]